MGFEKAYLNNLFAFSQDVWNLTIKNKQKCKNKAKMSCSSFNKEFLQSVK